MVVCLNFSAFYTVAVFGGPTIYVSELIRKGDARVIYSGFSLPGTSVPDVF